MIVVFYLEVFTRIQGLHQSTVRYPCRLLPAERLDAVNEMSDGQRNHNRLIRIILSSARRILRNVYGYPAHGRTTDELEHDATLSTQPKRSGTLSIN